MYKWIQKIKEIVKRKITEREVPVMKIGTNKKPIIVLWSVLIISVLFGVYKNFTAIDKHTIHEKEIIKQQVVDTNGIETFVRDFVEIYYTWENNMESIEKRAALLNAYLTQKLLNLNVDTVRIDIPTTSAVNDVQILDIRQIKKSEFKVAFKVVQTITEGGQIREVANSYVVTVYRGSAKDMVIIQNPTLSGEMKKSAYEPKVEDLDSSIDSEIVADATAFLNTFFQLYPKATDKELSYYVKGDILKPIGGEFIFSELTEPVFRKDGKNLKVSVYVKYLDQQTKAMQISQYHLTLKKGENWMIVDN